MARPRKNRIGEYAALLSEEIALQISRDLLKVIQTSQDAHDETMKELREELRELRKLLERMEKRQEKRATGKVGHWVPGRPGRPPKDATQKLIEYVRKKSADDLSDDDEDEFADTTLRPKRGALKPRKDPRPRTETPREAEIKSSSTKATKRPLGKGRGKRVG